MNGIEAVRNRSNGKILLSAALKKNNKIVIKVTDNGLGMSSDVAEKIFIPFFSTKKNGSGIGLSLCKQIMMLHHGSIQIQSKENVGTAIILEF